jgi:TetR/AcrR family transcriptional regulator, transcriptional repressor of aconitase
MPCNIPGVNTAKKRLGRKPCNHDEKRREIARAACKVILRLGIANAGLADFAREMGYTTGVLRHYFVDKEHLLLFAKNMLFDNADARAHRAAAALTGFAKLRALVITELPVDEDSIDRWRLLAVFRGSAIGDKSLMKLQQKRIEQGWLDLEKKLAALKHLGILPATFDSAIEARGISAYLEGLADQVIMDPRKWHKQQIIQLMSQYLDSRLNAPGNMPN